MKIREDLVFDKETGEIKVFVDIGDEGLNKKSAVLQQQCKEQSLAEKQAAIHMLTLMVRDLMFHLNFPIAQFATTGSYILYMYGNNGRLVTCVGVSAEYLMHIIWTAIRMLEMCAFTVISVVADGYNTNRRFFRLHKMIEMHFRCYC